MLSGASSAYADEVSFPCYHDSDEYDVIVDMLPTFNENTGYTVKLETVAYDAIRDQLENQLETDAAHDVARGTNVGGLNHYYLDLAPYVDGAA
ncbi:hypothetical protein [Yoonia sp. I 8.24]|uniref:hypothetical protein n=1 Tax=Yoonia sp. I 8.24 TaxID=1537229 RepID=UPI001EE040F3|nr:hypothetical protein [Yoonia sp. I 8.24]MCG3268272.1 hypothetical protein [Yoonia sp. I 8.24]